MNTNLYGADLDQPITALIARDALTECFFEAHCADTEIDAKDNEDNREYIKSIVKKSFEDSNGDFEKPTKESILHAMEKLQDFAKNFRDISLVQHHAGQMMKIVEKITE